MLLKLLRNTSSLFWLQVQEMWRNHHQVEQTLRAQITVLESRLEEALRNSNSWSIIPLSAMTCLYQYHRFVKYMFLLLCVANVYEMYKKCIFDSRFMFLMRSTREFNSTLFRTWTFLNLH
jgi:hypothetical protein